MKVKFEQTKKFIFSCAIALVLWFLLVFVCVFVFAFYRYTGNFSIYNKTNHNINIKIGEEKEIALVPEDEAYFKVKFLSTVLVNGMRVPIRHSISNYSCVDIYVYESNLKIIPCQ